MRPNVSRGSGHYGSKISEPIVAEILYRLSMGESPTEVSRLFGVSYWCVRDIRDRRTWRHVAPSLRLMRD